MKAIIYTLLILVLGFIYSCHPHPNELPCGIPKGLSSSVLGTNATLWWTAVRGTISYQGQYRVVGDSSWIGFGAYTDTTLLTRLNPFSNYEWRVQSSCSNGTSAFSASGTFQTGNLLGSCTYDSLLYFNAKSCIADPSARSLTAYQDSSYMSFVFSSYPPAPGSYLVVSPGSSAGGSTVSMTAKLATGVLPTVIFSSTGTDLVYASVSMTGGKIGLNLPKVRAANISNPSDSGTFYNIIINQQKAPSRPAAT